LDGQDDSACPSSSPLGNVEDSTLQYSGDACEDSYVLALRHDEIRRLDDLPMGVDMASRKSCMEDDELPMMSEPHFSFSQSPMLATTHEDINGILDMVEEPCVGIVHKGHMDLQTQEEWYGLEIVDLTHTYQYEESESPLLEISLMDQVVETDSLLGHLRPGSIFSDEDALLIGRDDHSMCLDTSVWDPGANDISRVSAQEDTTAHTGYNAIHMGVAIGDSVQWHRGGLSSTGDSGGLAVKHQLREEHEEYLGSLMSRDRYDPEIHEDIHRSQGPPFTWGVETVGHTRTHGDSRGSSEDTFIYVPGLVDLHLEDDPIVHPGSMMLQVYIGDHMSMQGHTVMSGSSQRHTEVYNGIQGDALDGREEMYLVEHGDLPCSSIQI
jgi:hypothetical protein